VELAFLIKTSNTMFRIKLFLISFFFLLSTCSSATTYYVSITDGNDSKSGKSKTTAWKTISKVNSKSFLPGDSILFKRGDVWREILNIPSSGTSVKYIVFSSYGKGKNPVILGSEQAANWVKINGNIWKSETRLTQPYFKPGYGNVYFVSKPPVIISMGAVKEYKQDFSNLKQEFDWCWRENELYIYSAIDPGTKYSSIEAGQRRYCADLNLKEYIEINGIDMFYGMEASVAEHDQTYNYSGFIFRNCESAFHGYPNGIGYGLEVCYNNMLIENNIFHDCGRRGLSLVNYGKFNISNIIIQNNTFYNGNHTTGPDIETGSSGGLYTGNLSNVIVRNNLIYDDENKSSYFSNSVFVQGPHGSTGRIFGFYFYNNIIRFPSSIGILLENVDESFIYNNTFYGHNKNSARFCYHVFYDNSCKKAELKNNIFYTRLAADVYGIGAAIGESSSQSHSEIRADYNLFYRINDRLRIVIVNERNYYMNSIGGLRKDLDWEVNSPVPADPLFVSPTDYHLKEGSPAIHKGIKAPFILKDFDGRDYNNPPSIGAFEYVK